LIAPGLIFGIAIAYAANLISPLRRLRVLGIIAGSGLAYFVAVYASMFMTLVIPITSPLAVGCLNFMFAGLIGGVILSLAVIPSLRLVPRRGIATALALAGAGLGYIQFLVALILRDKIQLQDPLPHVAGFMIWQTGVSAIIGAGLKNALGPLRPAN
jgi:hypothetical protein